MSASETRSLTLSGTTIFLTCLLTGTLDGGSAIIYHYAVGGHHPMRIFQFIASAIFGIRAMTDPSYAIYGIIFHYVIAYCFTAFFLIAYTKLSILRWNWLITGILYGGCIWAVMNLLVVPNTNVSAWKLNFQGSFIQAAILMVCISLPATFIAHKMAKPSAAS